MRWNRSHRSAHVEDRRGERPPGRAAGVGLLLPLLLRLGWRGVLVVLVLGAVLYFTGNLDGVLGTGGGTSARRGESSRRLPAGERAGGSEDELARFVGFVLDDTQAFWDGELRRGGSRYQPARLVVFSEATRSGCGTASAAVGPFYCPRDRRVYIDLSFYRELHRRFGAPGDFAQAYVITHEIGHHVQELHGVLGASRSRDESIQVELQADCLAGAWARHAERQGLLEPGDFEEGMTAAAAVGDDAIQRRTEGRERPESWTHGSSAQRQQAFRRGHGGGTLASCGL
jgi:hypothetical protein